MNQSTQFTVKGNTFPVKDRLKALGCRFEPTTKNWIARDGGMLAAAYRILDEFQQEQRLLKMTVPEILAEAKVTARGEALKLIRNRRQPPPIGARMQHPEHGLLVVVKTGPCFLDEAAGADAWRCHYEAVPVVENELSAAAA